MNRRSLLGALAAGAATALAGCGGGGGGDTPQGTLVGDSPDGNGDGVPGGTTTAPPTTGAQDVFEGVGYDIGPADGGGTRTSWTVENTTDRAWSVTVVSILEVEPAPDTPSGTATRTEPESTATVRTDEQSRRITVGAGEQATEEFVHDVAPTDWSSFRFDFQDLQEA